jgi:hypothetical protein
MALVTVRLAPGTFYAGIDRPFYASQEAVADTLRTLFGVTDVRFHPKTDALPSGVSPERDPNHAGPWSEWVSAEYSGPERSIVQEKLWSWLVFVPKPAAKKPVEPDAEPYGPPLPPGWVLPPSSSKSPASSSPEASSPSSANVPAVSTEARSPGGGNLALGLLAALAVLLWSSG